MHQRVELRTHPASRNGGYVLVIALLIMGLLFVVASSFMRLNLSEDQIATSDRDMILALNAAEAGVQQGIQNIRGAAGNLTGLLGNPTQNAGNFTFANGGSFAFTIANDPAESATPAVDSNGFLKITSTGRLRNATRIIETVLYVPTGPPFPGAIHVPGTEGDSLFSGTGFRADGNDTDPTTETPTGALTKLGVSAGSTTARNTIYSALTNAERTTPVFAGLAGDYGGQPSLGVDGSLDSDRVQQLARLWGSFAKPANIISIGRGTLNVSGTHTYANGAGGGPNASNNQAWGTPSNPGVFYIKGISETPQPPESGFLADYQSNPGATSGSVFTSGTFQGAGILILDGADLTISGNFRWEGIIIITGPLIGLGMVGDGTQKIFGAVVISERAHDDCAARPDCRELALLGNAAIRYSQTAINRAFGALAPRYAYWNERGL